MDSLVLERKENHSSAFTEVGRCLALNVVRVNITRLPILYETRTRRYKSRRASRSDQINKAPPSAVPKPNLHSNNNTAPAFLRTRAHKHHGFHGQHRGQVPMLP